MILSLLEKVVNRLEESNIPYMLSGSVAMGIYTLPRMTMDIDLQYINSWCDNLKLNTFNLM